MQKRLVYVFTIVAFLVPNISNAQETNDELGAWYMYFYNTTFKDSPWGIQGDLQYRNWNLGGDLEQLLIRSGVTYQPKNTQIKFTLGYGNITTGVIGSSDATSGEHRVYQEALYPVKNLYNKKFNIPVSRVDDVYGDKLLMNINR